MRAVFRSTALKVLLAGGLLGSAAFARQPHLVLLSWDGVPDEIADRLLAEGDLPNLAALAARGVRAEAVLPAFPSKTAVTHAAIFTGAWGDVNGISGNSVPRLPRAQHTILERASGYSSEALQVEPFYVTAARQGRRVVVLSATQSFPPDPYLERLRRDGVADDRLLVIAGFEHPISGPRMYGPEDLTEPRSGWSDLPAERAQELAFTVGDSQFFALAFDDAGDPTDGYDTVVVRQGDRSLAAAELSVTIKPAAAGTELGGWSPSFRVRLGDMSGYVYFRLFELAGDGSRMALYQRSVNAVAGASAAVLEGYLAAAGGFYDDAFHEYSRGLFGSTLWQKGTGEAERRVVETVRMDCALLRRGARYALATLGAEVLIHYTPLADSAGHVWMGVLDPESPRHDPSLARLLWPFYVEVLASIDGWLGDVVAAAGEDSLVAVVSDHGMAGVAQEFFPNRILEETGLLVRSSDGGVDLSQTRALAPAWGAQMVVVNSSDWKGGIVAADARERTVDEVVRALLGAREPDSGQPLVTAVFLPDRTIGLGIGGPAGGDVYFDVASGFTASARLADDVVTARQATVGFGEHGFFPFRRSMQAIFVAAGPGLRVGSEVPRIMQIDIAPTLLAALGLTPAQTVQGHILADTLAPAAYRVVEK